MKRPGWFVGLAGILAVLACLGMWWHRPSTDASGGPSSRALPVLPPRPRSPHCVRPGPHPGDAILGLPVRPSASLKHMKEEDLQYYADPGRDHLMKPEQLMALLDVRPGQVIADLGAGSGYFTYRFASAVGPQGHVWATEISLEALDFLQRRLRRQPAPNVSLVFTDDTDCLLPDDSVDMAFACEIHYFLAAHPPQPGPSWEKVLTFYRSVWQALKPGGRLAIIEKYSNPFLGEITAPEIVSQMEAAGFSLAASHDTFIRGKHFLIFNRGAARR